MKKGLFILLICCFVLLHAQTGYLIKCKAAVAESSDLLKEWHRKNSGNSLWYLAILADETIYKYLFGFQVSAASRGGVRLQLLKYGTADNSLTLARKINATE